MREKVFKNKFKIIAMVLIMFLTVGLLFTGCSQAGTVTGNIQKEADKFNVYRRMTFVNLYTNNLLYEVEGYFSVQTTYTNEYQGQQEIGIVVLTGKETYKMHYFSIAENVTYVIEQLENIHTNPYYWNIVWYVPLPNIVEG